VPTDDRPHQIVVEVAMQRTLFHHAHGASHTQSSAVLRLWSFFYNATSLL